MVYLVHRGAAWRRRASDPRRARVGPAMPFVGPAVPARLRELDLALAALWWAGLCVLVAQAATLGRGGLPAALCVRGGDAAAPERRRCAAVEDVSFSRGGVLHRPLRTLRRVVGAGRK